METLNIVLAEAEKLPYLKGDVDYGNFPTTPISKVIEASLKVAIHDLYDLLKNEVANSLKQRNNDIGILIQILEINLERFEKLYKLTGIKGGSIPNFIQWIKRFMLELQGHAEITDYIPAVQGTLDHNFQWMVGKRFSDAEVRLNDTILYLREKNYSVPEYTLRVSMIDGKLQPTTKDYRINRINVEVDRNQIIKQILNFG